MVCLTAAMTIPSLLKLPVRILPTGLCALTFLAPAACGSSDPADDRPGSTRGTIYGDYNDEWREHFPPSSSVNLEGQYVPPDVHLLRFCGHAVGTPENIPGTSDSLCYTVHLEKTVLGTGPTTLSIDGHIEVSVAGNDNQPPPTFVPRGSHSASVRRAWVKSSCDGEHYFDNPVRQEVTGTLELSVNTAKRVSGRFKIETSGRAAGPCPTNRTRADLTFDNSIQPSFD
ncbi:hypothetical protein SAMN04488504_108117 [Myxococcus virescens]|nr:hypothetical protein SAMN04488504_108117 [Myxococcus virescens]